MKPFFASASICLTALLAITAPLQAQTEPSTNSHISSTDSVAIPTQEFRDLIDGKISELTTKQFVYRRRLGTRPVAYTTDRTKLFNLYLDVYNRKGEYLKTKLHNQNFPNPDLN